MTINDLKPSLLALFVFFSCSFTIAQQTIPKDLKRLKGRLPWPVNNIREFFTYEQAKRNRSPVNGSYLMPFLTIRTDSAAIVKNPVTGVVSKTFDMDGSYSIMVTHGDYALIYNELDTIFINKGDTVQAHQPLGKITSQLDVLLFHKSKKIDPYEWFIPINKPTPIY